ncbi:MAG: urease accessory UreF family protein [Cyanobacteria bacterium J06626_6]
MHTSASESNQTADQQLTLMQLADSAFPSGSYTLSHGLESLVQAGALSSAQQLETFIRLLICNRIGSTDMVALTHAHRASQQNDMMRILAIDARLFAQTPIEKTRQTQRQSGRALLMVAAKTWHHPQLEQLQQLTHEGQINCLHPIVFAIATQVAGIGEDNARTAFIHGFVTGVLGAGMRLGVIGHVQAQQIRLALNEDMAEICETASHLSLDEMWSCTPLIDLAQMRQGKLARRLFAS